MGVHVPHLEAFRQGFDKFLFIIHQQNFQSHIRLLSLWKDRAGSGIAFHFNICYLSL
jgi:hypothetical protein